MWIINAKFMDQKHKIDETELSSCGSKVKNLWIAFSPFIESNCENNLSLKLHKSKYPIFWKIKTITMQDSLIFEFISIEINRILYSWYYQLGRIENLIHCSQHYGNYICIACKYHRG